SLLFRDLCPFPTRRSSDLWGIPTKDCLRSVRNVLPDIPLVASGGMKTGHDAAKAVALGADTVGFARKLLEAATISTESVEEVMRSEEHTSELQSRFDLVCR